MNNKQRQSGIYKQKAIYQHIMSVINKTIVEQIFWADDKPYYHYKEPTNIHYGYKVVKWCYFLRTINFKQLNEGLMCNAKIYPIYNKSKATKV